VRIDSDRCQGHAQCAIAAPAVFDLDDEGFGIVGDDGLVPEGEERAAQQAVSSCPEQAILVIE
jgi:ferredoxin